MIDNGLYSINVLSDSDQLHFSINIMGIKLDYTPVDSYFVSKIDSAFEQERPNGIYSNLVLP